MWVRQRRLIKCQKIGKLCAAKMHQLFLKSKTPSYRYIFVVQGLPSFLTRDLATLNNTLSILHRPRPLAAGPIGNAEIIESLLTMIRSHSLNWFSINWLRS